jgi:hypothetical protein
MARRYGNKRKRFWVQAMTYGFTAELLFILIQRVPFFATNGVLSKVIYFVIGLAIFSMLDYPIKYLLRLPWYVLAIIFTAWLVGIVLIP